MPHIARALIPITIILGVLLSSCKEDDIPATIAGPFLLTNLVIGKTVSPPTDSTLAIGDSVTFNFQVGYTLAPGGVAPTDSLGISFLALQPDSMGNIDTIGILQPSFPAQTRPFVGNNAVYSFSQKIGIIDLGGPYFIDLQAFILTSDTTYIPVDDVFWIAQ